MAIASKSVRSRDHSAVHAEQIPHMPEKSSYNSSFWSRGYAEFAYYPQNSSCPLVSVEDLQQKSTEIGSEPEKKVSSDSTRLLPDVSAGCCKIDRIMQGRDGSYTSSQHHPVANDLGLASWEEIGSLCFTDLTEFWGHSRLHSRERATNPIPPPQQKLGWTEGSSSCPTSGNPVTADSSAGHEKTPGQRSCSYSLPISMETSAGEVDLECPFLLQTEHRNHSPCLASTSAVTSVGLSSAFVYQVPSRPSKSAHVAVPLSSGCQPEIPEMTLSRSHRPATKRQGRFHSQSLVGDGVQAAVLQRSSGTLVDSEVPGDQQHNLVQQLPGLSLPRSSALRRRGQPGECFTDGIANQYHLELLQEARDPSLQPPGKHQKRRAINGIRMDHSKEVEYGPPALDHVQRERQRRDIMTSRIAALELLLPRSSKRDRVSVVYDTIQLLQKLERDVKVLQKKFHEAKLRKASSTPSSRHRGPVSVPKSIDCNMGTKRSYYSNGVIKHLGTHMKPIMNRTQPAWGTSWKSRPTQMIASPQYSVERNISDKRSISVEFHVHLDDAVAVKEEKLLKCRCRVGYLSTVMGVADEFRLDVVSCNITKLCGYFICIMGLKTRTKTDKTTVAQVTFRLQSLVDIDIAREPGTVSLSAAKIFEAYN